MSLESLRHPEPENDHYEESTVHALLLCTLLISCYMSQIDGTRAVTWSRAREWSLLWWLIPWADVYPVLWSYRVMIVYAFIVSYCTLSLSTRLMSLEPLRDPEPENDHYEAAIFTSCYMMFILLTWFQHVTGWCHWNRYVILNQRMITTRRQSRRCRSCAEKWLLTSATLSSKQAFIPDVSSATATKPHIHNVPYHEVWCVLIRWRS